jgi:hypothetical protein
MENRRTSEESLDRNVDPAVSLSERLLKLMQLVERRREFLTSAKIKILEHQ